MSITGLASCMICMDDKYNKTTKKPVDCLFCHAIICRDCLKQTLLYDSAIDICCPGCRAVWSQDFIIANLPLSFRTNELKVHRENVLYERERVRLQMFMDDAQRYKVALTATTRLKQELKTMKDQYEAFPSVIEYERLGKAFYRNYLVNTSTDVYQNLQRDYINARRVVDTAPELLALRVRIRACKREIKTHSHAFNTFGQPVAPAPVVVRGGRARGGGGGGGGGGDGGGSGATEETATPATRRIVMACPATDCAGFVDTLWKCGMCETKVCKDCRIEKRDGHECNADDIATARAISADSKPCPKCTAPISKVSGCDQMWCTLCHTTFSWNTGRVETAIVHNPHYFQWLASSGQTIPRADLPGMGCDIDGNIMHTLTRLYAHMYAQPMNEDTRNGLVLLGYISERHRERLHLENYELRRIRNNVRDYMDDAWRRELCIKRLASEISEAEWRTALQRAEKAHHKERAWLQLMEMYAVTTRDILGRITLDGADLEEIRRHHEQLHQFTYEQNLSISKAYGCVLIKITYDMKESEREKKKEKKCAKKEGTVTAAVGGAGAATADDDA
jgi:hypothetical protein